MQKATQTVSPNGVAALYFELKAENEAATLALLRLFKPILERFQGPKIFCVANTVELASIQRKLAQCNCSDSKLYVLDGSDESVTAFNELESEVAALCRQTGQQVLALSNSSKLYKLKQISKTVIYLQDAAKLLKNIFYFYHAYMRLENVSFHAKTHLSVGLLSTWQEVAEALSLSCEETSTQHQTVHGLMDDYLLTLMRQDAYGDLVRDLMTKAQGKLNQLHFSMSQRRDSIQKQIAETTNDKTRQRLEEDVALVNTKLEIVCNGINEIKPLKGKKDLVRLKTILDTLYNDEILRKHLSSKWSWLHYVKVILLPSYTRGKLSAIRTEVLSMIRETKRELAKTNLPTSAIAYNK